MFIADDVNIGVAAGGTQQLPSRVSATGNQGAPTRLSDIAVVEAGPPKVKTTLQWLRECLSLGLTWLKIGVNRFLPGEIFSLWNL